MGRAAPVRAPTCPSMLAGIHSTGIGLAPAANSKPCPASHWSTPWQQGPCEGGAGCSPVDSIGSWQQQARQQAPASALEGSADFNRQHEWRGRIVPVKRSKTSNRLSTSMTLDYAVAPSRGSIGLVRLPGISASNPGTCQCFHHPAPLGPVAFPARLGCLLSANAAVPFTPRSHPPAGRAATPPRSPPPRPSDRTPGSCPGVWSCADTPPPKEWSRPTPPSTD